MAAEVRWRDPRNEMPEQSQSIGVIYQHNKEHKFFSSQIMFGRAEYDQQNKNCMVCSDDFTGAGSWSVYFNKTIETEEFGTIDHDDVVLAWIPIEEFGMPDWIPHNPHWGSI